VGAATVIAVDLDPRKLEWATGFGATHTVNASEVDPVEEPAHVVEGVDRDPLAPDLAE